MFFTHDIAQALKETPSTEYGQALEATKHAINRLRKHREENTLPVLNIADRSDDLEAIERAADAIRTRFKTLIVVGMGASSLGGKTLTALRAHPFAAAQKGVNVQYIENIDPFSAEQIMNGIVWKETAFLLISKSGDTAETLAHALVFIEWAKTALGEKVLGEHFFVITMPTDSAIRRIAARYGMQRLEHDPHIGGRFAALTSVGLLPARVMGLDIGAIRKGAGAIVERCFSESPPEPAQGAALQAALQKNGKTVSVLMPYADRLWPLAAWHRQLWGESLGKNGQGTTPAPALGATDQHSQLQLYLDGPRDAFITLLCLPHQGLGPKLPMVDDPALGYLSGRTIGDVMEAEQRATAETLIRNHCPVRLITIAALNEESLGALMMHFMLETMIMAEISGINAFDQPAVEEGKKLARAYLAKKA